MKPTKQQEVASQKPASEGDVPENPIRCRFEDSSAVTWTVGGLMHFKCEGEWPEFDVTKLKLEVVGRPEYSIRLLALSKNAKGDVLVEATSYLVGDYQNVQLLFSDGERFQRTEPLSWKMQSVIDPNQPEAAKPFGPFGPWHLYWPWWFYLVIGLVIVGIFFGVFKLWKNFKKRSLLKKQWREYREKHSPFDELQKSIRRLDRANKKSLEEKNLLEELKKSFSLYLMMEFEIDTMGRMPKHVLKQLRRRAPAATPHVLAEIKQYLDEFEKVIDDSDWEKMVLWTERLSEKVDRKSLGMKDR